jgi:hypothetical protein
MRSHNRQDSAHGPKADARPQKELEGQEHQINFAVDGGELGVVPLGFELRLGLRGSCLIVVARTFNAPQFFAQVAIVVGTALGFLLPPRATLLELLE